MPGGEGVRGEGEGGLPRAEGWVAAEEDYSLAEGSVRADEAECDDRHDGERRKAGMKELI